MCLIIATTGCRIDAPHHEDPGMSSSTSERLLDAAEVLFALHGIRNTSVRMIVGEIGANVAAIRFHFGSLEGLKRAVLMRRFPPLVEKRLSGLAEARSAGHLAPRDIFQLWFMPMVEMMVSQDDGERSFPLVLARMLAERAPEYQALLDQELADHVNAFIHALHETHPSLSRDQVAMRFDFLIGAFGHAPNRVHVPPGKRLTRKHRDAIERTVAEFFDFAEAALGTTR